MVDSTRIKTLDHDEFDHYDHSVDDVINHGETPWLSWVIWGTAAFFYLYEYILRVSFSVMTQPLMQSFEVTSAALGVLASFYYYAYTPLQIPCGVIVDRLGVRRVVTISALFCAMGSFIFSKSDSLLMAQMGRMLMGAGSACAYLSTAKLAAEWFPPRKFALLTSVTMGLGLLGATFGGKPFAIIVNAFGWQKAMLIAAIVGVGVAVFSWIIIRDRKETIATSQLDQDAVLPSTSLLSGLKIIATNPQSWLIGLYGCFMYLPLSAFAELWAVPYLMQLHGVDNEVASSASIMVFIGMAIGCPLAAWLSDKVESRKKIMGTSALLTASLFVFIVYCPIISFHMTFILLFITGLIAGGQILYFAAAKEINPPQMSATTVAFTNTLVMISAIIFQPLLGYILDFVWDGARTAEGLPLYAVSDYQIALTPVPICLFISWLILKSVKETYPK